jgi:hypothetical protein
MYKVVHDDTGHKRFIVFKSAHQLVRYLKSVNGIKSTFKVYKKKGN